jgi:adenylosuccinate lyase
MRVWDEGVRFRDLVMEDARIREKMSREELDSLFDVKSQLRNIDRVFERTFGESDQESGAGVKESEI